MRSNTPKSLLIKSGLAASVLLLASGAAFGQQVVNLTAAPVTATLPDGSAVPMWGYRCMPVAVGVTPTNCRALNPAVTALNNTTAWSPVVITVPTGQSLTINLTNSLTFTPTGSLVPNTVPTSLTIVGQLGGGLGLVAGATATTIPCTAGGGCTDSPSHATAQSNVTWPIAGAAGTPGTPPAQGPRVQSFGTEVAVGTTATALTWTTPRPGTYLIESGTHPSIQGPMGLYGILVVTAAPVGAVAGNAYGTVGTATAVSYNADIPLALSEIDPVQNAAVDTAVRTVGFTETMVWSGQFGGCGNPLNADRVTPNLLFHACYPPAVNYTPLYYLVNGVAFDKTHPVAAGTSLITSLFPTAPATGVTGTVLVRLVNAGLRMHVPAIVGSLTGGTAIPVVPPTPGFGLVAEDGNPLPGVRRTQSEVFMAAGKTYDLMINVPAAGGTALPIYDRELSLSGNATARDAGMLAYISVNSAVLPAVPAFTPAVARADTYNSVRPCVLAPCAPVIVSDPSKGVIANDTNVYGVTVLAPPAATAGALTLNRDGTFTFVPTPGTTASSFTYCANGTVAVAVAPATVGVCSSGISATVTLGAAPIEAASGITVNNITYRSTVSTTLSIRSPGILSVDSDAAGYPLTVNALSVTPTLPLVVAVDSTGAFTATVPTCTTATGCSYSFTYKAQNSQGTISAGTATVTLVFPAPSNLAVTVLDGTDKVTPITDYRWIIEEDRSFYVDPTKTTNTCALGAACPIVPTFGTNFHTSFMPVVATGCTGTLSCETGQSVLGAGAACDVGDGVCRTGVAQKTAVSPSQVHLDPTKRYYISVLPGDAANPFETANAVGGHGMGGAPIPAACTPVPPATTCVPTVTPTVTVLAQPTPFPPSKLTVFVFEDDFPLNGEHDGGGGVDALATSVEPGLGGFNIHIEDDAGGPGDPTGQANHDMFNQPLVNSLAGYIDPATGNDACPISANSRIGQVLTNPALPFNAVTNPFIYDITQTGITGTIITCPMFESDGKTMSPLAGQAIIANMMPGRYGVVATPGADRIARGEEWLQTNTLDGQKAHDSFLRIGGPSFFQEFGPSGFHVSIGFANPKIINGRLAGVCAGDAFLPGAKNCNNSVTGRVTTERMSRTPDQRLYSSGSRASFAFSQCYVSLGDPDGEDFAFTKCAADGTFTLSGLPPGDWRVTTFDQWNDQLVDGLSTPVRLGGGTTFNMGDIAANQWQANFMTRTFLDVNGDGVSNVDAAGNPTEPGLALVKTNVRFRDGSFSNRNNTDLNGFAAFNEEFPLFSWYVIETDVTRYKNTGTHVVYDAGGPADGTPCGTTVTPAIAPCGASRIAANLANTVETVSLPTSLRVPGAVYCAGADCTGKGMPGNTSGASTTSDPPSVCNTVAGVTTCTTTLSTGRIDPPWVLTEAWQGFSGQNNFLEFGKKPYAVGENGGIRGHVIYTSTRPFDDPQWNTQNVWEPLVPGVTINLYQETAAADGTTGLKLVDFTQTSSWDNWVQGFRTDNNPNMNCPGQGRNTGADADLFFFTLYNQPMYLDVYNNGGTPAHTVPFNSQFKCYDGMHNWNQLQPAPYDGMYQFPSVLALNPTTGAPVGTNCAVTTCIPNPDTTDLYRRGTPMLPMGKYVVEVVVPPGYELVKEEDKNILIGDNFIAPATVEFPGLGSAIYIIPDQAQVGAAQVSSAYNANSAQNPTASLGRIQTLTSHEGDTATVSTFWPCVGATRIVPDYISLFPASHEVAPFAGATKNLCDRKEVMLDDQTSSQAEFFVWTPTHAAAHFTGVITDDFTSEFDPFSPQFGEKFSPANLPVSVKDWKGNEVSRVYADQWGSYDGMTYSTWEVNPPNPTGYSPTMMVTCMNDAGPIIDTRVTIVNDLGATVSNPTLGQPITDPLYQQSYSQFCYEIPFMPGATQYMDTPVTPTSAFAGAGYNNPDCAYPDTTPAIKEVDGDGIGPYVSAVGRSLTITALGDQTVNNHGYSGPAATLAPFNAKTVTRHYGFGATAGTITIGGIATTATTWNDTTIVVPVPPGVPVCAIQQQGFTGTLCGQLVITAANGKQSIDTVTVTVGGNAPTHVTASGSIQSAIDAATPGDLIIIDPTCVTTNTTTQVPCAVGTAATGQTHLSSAHSELLVMWKPVRLQGVGAPSSVINANAHPAGKLEVWRRNVNCLFGLGLNGYAISAANPYDPTGTFACDGTLGWTGFVPYGAASDFNPQIDRLPLEATVGWDANLNGNLAELLQEPSLMGALEGAGITVLAKGVNFASNPFDPTLLAGFPVGTPLLTNSAADCTFTSNFLCNPSSIDGLTIHNSSQGGGAILVHGWAHKLQIANNRVQNNSGTLSGGINVGQGEYPPGYLFGSATNAAPGSCLNTGLVTNQQQPYCLNLYVNVHHNAVMLNASTGDELFSATPAGAGGVSFCTGSDYYKFNYNWVCGNLSTGDGGGVAHLGFSWNGDIEHNWILFNQSTNPTIATNGGGILVYGAPDVDPPCGVGTDVDCLSAANLISPSDGVGPGLVINANLIMGNAAESGSGGGLRLHNVNGSDVINFPTTPSQWYAPSVTNNIIVNNVAGWDGAGISLQDALAVNIVNNTIMSNDTTASSGVLFNTFGAPLASSQGPCPIGQRDIFGICTVAVTASTPQPAGLVSVQNSAVLTANMPATITCPTGHYVPGTPASNGTCRSISYPMLVNDVFYQNRSFNIVVGGLGTGGQSQQNVVTLANGSGTVPASQGTTGACVTGSSYWDIGVRGDFSPGTSESTFRLAPTFSVLTSTAGYPAGNLAVNPAVVLQYCNGSRVPPENGGLGYNVPPGISDATVPNPIFALTPAATVDEGNNWINITWGPLSTTNPAIRVNGHWGGGTALGNYAITAGSPAVNAGTPTGAPATDFFGNPRDCRPDIGATEIQVPGGLACVSVSGGPLNFGSVTVGATSTFQTLTLTNSGNAAMTGITLTFTGPYARFGTTPGSCIAGGSLAAVSTCTINVVFRPTAPGATVGSNLAIAGSVAVTGSPVALTGTGVAATATATFTPGTRDYGTVARGTTLLGPVQTFTLTNTGTAPIPGITAGVLGGLSPLDYFINQLTSTCGTGHLLNITTLAVAPAASSSCVVVVQFRPRAAPNPTGVKSASVSLTAGAAGLQTSTLTGTAN